MDGLMAGFDWMDWIGLVYFRYVGEQPSVASTEHPAQHNEHNLIFCERLAEYPNLR